MTVDQAVDILQTTKPFRLPFLIAYETDPKKEKQNEDLYERQVLAISVVGAAKKADSARLLIPFLDYSAPGFNVYLVTKSAFGTKPEKEDVRSTILHWPVLKALFATPGSSNVLMAYALNPRNDIAFRIGAFSGLRYYSEKENFKIVAKELHTELDPLGVEVQGALGRIEDGTDVFQGASPNDSFPTSSELRSYRASAGKSLN